MKLIELLEKASLMPPKLSVRDMHGADIPQEWADLPVHAIYDDTRLIGAHDLLVLTPAAEAYIQELPSILEKIGKDDRSRRESTALFVLVDAAWVERNRANKSYVKFFENPMIYWLCCDNLLHVQGCLCSALHENPSQSLELIGITGTNGKTSIAWALYQFWKQDRVKAAFIGTLGVYYTHEIANEYHEEHYLTGYTTPPAWQIHKILKKMLDLGVSKVAMEASSEALALGRMEGLNISIAVFSGLSMDHLDYHQSMESYFNAKKRLFDLALHTPLPVKLRKHGDASMKKHFVIYSEDAYGKRLASELSSAYANTAKVVDYACHLVQIEPIFAQAPIPNFQAINLSLAWAVLNCKQSLSQRFQEALLKSSRAPGRFSIHRHPKYPSLCAVVDYAHTPDALERLLLASHELATYTICVFGCGGERDALKRSAMGAIAAKFSDVLIICDDNPRYEDPQVIRQAILGGAYSVKARRCRQIMEIADRRNAIFRAIRIALSRDDKKTSVLIAGKGHEDYQIIRGQRHPFYDPSIVTEAFASLAYSKSKTEKGSNFR